MTEQLGGSYSKIDEKFSKCNIVNYCNYIAVAVTASTVKQNFRLLELFYQKYSLCILNK